MNVLRIPNRRHSNNVREVILCKYGEIVLKGANRGQFEATLIREVKRRASHIGKFDVSFSQSTVTIEPKESVTDDQFDEMFDQAKKVFGFTAITRAAVAEKKMDDIFRVAKEYLPERLIGYKTFKCDAKRSDKTFPLKSPEISAEVGGLVLSLVPHLTVDVKNPDVIVRVEVRENHAYIHAGQDKGAGGIPLGSGGRGLVLLSGGIDSPVAAYMMAKRGMTVDALHFESFPYTSERAREKVLELAKELAEYCGRIRVHIISLTHIQEEIRDRCDEDYFTLLLRRFMMELADRTAKHVGARALITGESLGQVASQTLAAICVTDMMADMPVFRPLIGMDKEDIVSISRHIGTFETSIQPFEDCCTVFTPRHPKTQPELEKVIAQEEKLDRAALIDEAFATRHTVTIEQFE